MFRLQRSGYFIIIALIVLTSCVQLNAEIGTPTPEKTVTKTASPTFSSSPSPSPSPTPAIFPCSPVDGIALDEIPQFITQPFIAPQPRKDDGHHGIDIAFFSEGDRPLILGLSIHSILPGKVAAVLNNQGPYGNMIIVETPLELLPLDWEQLVPFPTIAPTVTSDGRLACPESGEQPTYDTSGNRSLYVLYSHLLNPPEFHVGDDISYCQIIGQVGNTGWSSDPHLHLETRIGPSEARFGEIVHRVPATLEQTYNYCVWRISNLFQLMDPMNLLSIIP